MLKEDVCDKKCGNRTKFGCTKLCIDIHRDKGEDLIRFEDSLYLDTSRKLKGREEGLCDGEYYTYLENKLRQGMLNVDFTFKQ